MRVNRLSNFIQLSLNFDIQEKNWIRWAGGKNYLNHLYWNGCMTGRLQESTIELSESASDTSDEIAILDAWQFNVVVMWLPELYRKVYLAHIFNKVVIAGRIKTTKVGEVRHQCQLLGISKYRYDQVLTMTIKMIKCKGGFV
jgi:hypothetical protein